MKKKRFFVFVFLSFLVVANLVSVPVFIYFFSKHNNSLKRSDTKQIRMVVFNYHLYEVMKHLTSKGSSNIDLIYLDINEASEKFGLKKHSLSFRSKSQILVSEYVVISNELSRDILDEINYKNNIINILSYFDKEEFLTYTTRDGAVIKNIDIMYSPAKLTKILPILTTQIIEIDKENKSYYLDALYQVIAKIKSTNDNISETLRPVKETNNDLVVIGNKMSYIFFENGVEDIITFYKDPKDHLFKDSINNIANILKTGNVRCVANTSGMSMSAIEKIASKYNVRYVDVIDSSDDYDFNNFLKYSRKIVKCLER